MAGAPELFQAARGRTRLSNSASTKDLSCGAEYADIVGDFFKSIGYELGRPTPLKNAALENHIRLAIESESIPEPHRSGLMDVVPYSAAVGDLFYPEHPFDVQCVIGVLSVLLTYMDDAIPRNLLPETQGLTAKLVNGKPIQDPVLGLMVRMLGTEVPKHFGPYGANAITCGFLNFAYAHLLEGANPHGFQALPSSARFARFLRYKGGLGEVYTHFMFPTAMFPEHLFLEKYIQTVPDIIDVIEIGNDILSFYKEAVVGAEKNNYILNGATARGCGPLEYLQDVCEQVSSSFEDAHATLKAGDQSLAAVFASFLDGYVTFHFTQKRYRLDEAVSNETH